MPEFKEAPLNEDDEKPAVLVHGGFGKRKNEAVEWQNNTAKSDGWQRFGDVAAWMIARFAKRHDLPWRRARDIAALTNGGGQ